ncbi:tripartite motif-containing protein 45-like [Mytilus californianus]|uniref:tripartite motif-containing protein 45-like n=1 Tax=Mytilus californianus TaxID=6549 RepID=UPI002245AD42|nr:tripartite motif-containing protein 45-like [Mytilus californianus]
MATPTKDTELFDDLLTCTICLETFKVPKYLPCLHTFCETCIDTYIVSSKEKDNTSEGFRRPVCRVSVSFKGTQEKPEAWASKLPRNHFVTSMLDKRAIQRSEKMCNSCQVKNQTREASYWCTTCEEAFCGQCEEYHKSFKIKSKHTVIAVQEIQSDLSGFQLSEALSCEEHTEKIVEVFCVDHSKPCCTLCSTLTHRKCDNVISIQKAASDIKQSNQTTELVWKLKEKGKEFNEIVQNRKQSLDNIQTEYENILQEISKLKERAIEHLNKIEDQIKFEMSSSKKEVDIKLTDEIDKFSNYKSMVNNWERLLIGTIKRGSDQQCLLEVNKIGSKLTTLEEEINETVKSIKNVSFRLVPSDHMTKFTSSTESLGSFKMNEQCLERTRSTLVNKTVNFRTGVIKVVRTIAEKLGQASAIFVRDYVVLTSGNKEVVEKYSTDGKLLSSLKVRSYPTDVTQVDQSQVAITLYSLCEILIVDSIDLQLLKTLNLHNIIGYGLCFVENDKFILSVPTTLTWMNSSSGQKLKEKATCGSSFFVSTSDKKDCIYGDGKNSVSRVVGDITSFTYTSSRLTVPRGIGIDFEGNIYIAGHSS